MKANILLRYGEMMTAYFWEPYQYHSARSSTIINRGTLINTLNAEFNPICHLLALLGVHHILHVSRVRFNTFRKKRDIWLGFYTMYSAALKAFILTLEDLSGRSFYHFKPSWTDTTTTSTTSFTSSTPTMIDGIMTGKWMKLAVCPALKFDT
jgi:hypothetical protein